MPSLENSRAGNTKHHLPNALPARTECEMSNCVVSQGAGRSGPSWPACDIITNYLIVIKFPLFPPFGVLCWGPLSKQSLAA